jgi:hypothetical protein
MPKMIPFSRSEVMVCQEFGTLHAYLDDGSDMPCPVCAIRKRIPPKVTKGRTVVDEIVALEAPGKYAR